MHGEHGRACPSHTVPRLQHLRLHLGAQLCRQPPQPGQTRLNSGGSVCTFPVLPGSGLPGAPWCPQYPPVPPSAPRAVPAAAPWRPGAGSLQRGRDLLYGY